MIRQWVPIAVLALAGCSDSAGPEPVGPQIECQSDGICDDGLDCTADRCDETLRCVHQPVGRGCPVNGQCLDCSLFDDATSCTRATCVPDVGCVAEPAPEGLQCAAATCAAGSWSPAGTCDAAGSCVLPTPQACEDDVDGCAWAFCDELRGRCVRLPALTAQCQLGATGEPETWRGVELRRAAGASPSDDDWEIHRRQVTFHDGAIVLSTFVDETGAEKTDVDPSVQEREPGQFELLYPNRIHQVAMTADATVLAGFPRYRTGLTLLLRPPERPVSPDAMVGRWFVVLVWKLPAWAPQAPENQVGALTSWFGELVLVGRDDAACSRSGDTIRGTDGEFWTVSGDCASVSPDGSWHADLRVGANGLATGSAVLRLHGQLGARGELAVAHLGSEHDGVASEPLHHGLALMVRIRDGEKPRLDGRYASLITTGGRRHLRGALDVGPDGFLGGQMDAVDDGGACISGAPGPKTPYRVVPTTGASVSEVWDLQLLPRFQEPPYGTGDRARHWYTAAALPEMDSLGGASPLALGAAVGSVDIIVGAATPSPRGPALMVWQPPGAPPMVAPFTQDAATWCLP